MIQVVVAKSCPRCKSTDILKNGTDYKGDQKYHCNACRTYGTLDAASGYTPERNEEILHAYQERPSMRGIQRVFGTERTTLARWLKQKAQGAPVVVDTLAQVHPGDVLELDESLNPKCLSLACSVSRYASNPIVASPGRGNT
jgi:insertion element IS1 protein InsB